MPDVSSTGNPMWTPDGRFIFTWSEYEDRYLYWVTPFGAGAASPYPLLLDKPYGYVPGLTAYAQESLSPSKEKLLFTTHTDSGQLEYWVVPISAARGKSTGPAVKVFDKGPFERDACWSPDESRIALMYQGDLWIAQTDGSPPVKFTTTADRNVMRRTWSPDGNAISWISHDPNSGQSVLRIRGLSEEQSREIFTTTKFIGHSWSPGGTWIVYELDETELGTMRELFVVPVSGGESRRLIEVPNDYHASFGSAWCPQDEQLVLLCGQELLLFDPASGQRQEVSTLPDPTWGRCFDMQWSPDGKTLGLVLEARPDSTHGGEDTSSDTRLFTVTIPEGKWTELAGEAGTNYYFVWSPDGKWVAYNSEGWIRKRPEGVLWEVDVDPFLRRATGEDAASITPAARPNAKTVTANELAELEKQ
jgi:Tol biopolymer transport system component